MCHLCTCVCVCVCVRARAFVSVCVCALLVTRSCQSKTILPLLQPHRPHKFFPLVQNINCFSLALPGISPRSEAKEQGAAPIAFSFLHQFHCPFCTNCIVLSAPIALSFLLWRPSWFIILLGSSWCFTALPIRGTKRCSNCNVLSTVEAPRSSRFRLSFSWCFTALSSKGKTR